MYANVAALVAVLFQEQIGVPFRARAAEDNIRFSNIQSQLRSRQLLVRRQWRTTSSFFTGPRGSWRYRCVPPGASLPYGLRAESLAHGV